MPGRLADRIFSWIDASLAALGHGFIQQWTRVERSYRRPLSWLAFHLKFAFYPLLALGAIAWLAWDWSDARSLDSAEDAIFDQVVQWRPFEPKPSGRVVVVEIDECSIEYFRARGEGGWPWSRQRHADLLDQLDRAGVRAVGYDVLFADPSPDDPLGDQTLEAMAMGGAGRFVFGSTRLHPDYDESSPLRASQAPSAFALVAAPRADPRVALLLPYGEAMTRYSAIANVTRNKDGVLRDIPLREAVGDWASALAGAAPGDDRHAAIGASARRRRAAELATGHAAAACQRGRPAERRQGRLPRRDGQPACVERTRGAGRLHRIGPQRRQAHARRSGHAGRRGPGRGHRGPACRQRDPHPTRLAEVRAGHPADAADHLRLLAWRTGSRHRLDLRRGQRRAAGRGFRRPHVLRLLLRHLRQRRFRQPGLRILSRLRGCSARTRGGQRRFPAGIRSRRGPLARRGAPALRARCATRRHLLGASPSRIPAPAATVPVRRQRRGDAGGRGGAQELVARCAERYDDPGVARLRMQPRRAPQRSRTSRGSSGNWPSTTSACPTMAACCWHLPAHGSTTSRGRRPTRSACACAS